MHAVHTVKQHYSHLSSFLAQNTFGEKVFGMGLTVIRRTPPRSKQL